jgi:hypothetical protein
MTVTPTPTLRVVVPTVKPWPWAYRALDALREQALATNTEIIIADGHGGVPSSLEAPHVTLSLVGADVFRLRAEAVERAQGDLIALLEDHITVAHDCCDVASARYGDVGKARLGRSLDHETETLTPSGATSLLS